MSGTDITARLIGREQRPLVVIDGFAHDPDALRAAAIATQFEPAGRHYPGIRAALPTTYLAEQAPVIATVLREVFGCAATMRVLDASYAMVTTAPEELTLQQRLPHIDAVTPGRVALLHYLSPDGGDGTAFFRHRATGFETIDEARAPTYLAQLDGEVRSTPPPATYVTGDTPLFERIAHVEARYNRALLYWSSSLHSGAIGSDTVLSSDPATGRLTITAFLATR